MVTSPARGGAPRHELVLPDPFPDLDVVPVHRFYFLVLYESVSYVGIHTSIGRETEEEEEKEDETHRRAEREPAAHRAREVLSKLESAGRSVLGFEEWYKHALLRSPLGRWNVNVDSHCVERNVRTERV